MIHINQSSVGPHSVGGGGGGNCIIYSGLSIQGTGWDDSICPLYGNVLNSESIRKPYYKQINTPLSINESATITKAPIDTF